VYFVSPIKEVRDKERVHPRNMGSRTWPASSAKRVDADVATAKLTGIRRVKRACASGKSASQGPPTGARCWQKTLSLSQAGGIAARLEVKKRRKFLEVTKRQQAQPTRAMIIPTNIMSSRLCCRTGKGEQIEKEQQVKVQGSEAELKPPARKN